LSFSNKADKILHVPFIYLYLTRVSVLLVYATVPQPTNLLNCYKVVPSSE